MTVHKLLIAYFSGTGGTARVACAFQKEFEQRGVIAESQEIKIGKSIDNGSVDLLILLFAVHAANAPMPVYQWLEQLKPVEKMPAVVISVSGAGEIFPNKACRESSKKRLKAKGYDVVYEQTIIMPSNMCVATPDHLAVKLLDVLPKKIERIADDVLSDVVYKVKPRIIDRLTSRLLEMEKRNTKVFGNGLYVDENCTGCGWCEQKCPADNIRLKEGKPLFAKQCVMCFGCVYGCPQHAIRAKRLKWMLNKHGFDIRRIEKQLSKNIEPQEGKDGVLWKGVRKYLNE